MNRIYSVRTDYIGEDTVVESFIDRASRRSSLLERVQLLVENTAAGTTVTGGSDEAGLAQHLARLLGAPVRITLIDSDLDDQGRFTATREEVFAA